MDCMDAFAAFVAAVDEGSLAAAGRKLGRSPAALTRAIAALEEMAGARLLHRSPRGLRLTADGERHLDLYRRMLETWAELATGDQPASLRGTIVMTAPELFGRSEVLPLLEDFLDAHPAMRARLLLRNDILDLVTEGIDVAVRLAELDDSALVATRVGTVRRIVCASARYLERHPVPRLPSDLRACACVGLNPKGERDLWPMALGPGEPARSRSVAVAARISTDNAAAALDCVRRGRGIGQFMSYQVAEDIAAGRLVRLLAEYETAPLPVSVVFHRHRTTSPGVRALLDFVVPRLRIRMDAMQALVG